MAHAFTLAELANLAIGTPEVGVCNFNAMHALLHGILEQLEIGHVTKMVDQEEKEFIKPSGPLPTEGDDEEEEEEQAAAGGKAKAKTKAKAPKPVVGKSLFHQLEEKVSRLQAAFEALNQLPTAADLLSKSGPASQAPPAVQASGSSGAVKDMWQLMQLRKKTEANEDGINKVMATLQELMNEMNSMNATNERLRKEVDKCRRKVFSE
ncbi:uncharacterized protein C16orf96-like isoform X2 [Callorhinchus milii]|uniref:uncharacterized protein C16orf96-like isoform X2 n=1 Tax=Callorhinchus milii TaxID=7868 RepID=UPI001C3F671A|nr:uncharacterized protein C16orf96-like isoform X2 [Callorhinchus milii]